MGCNVDYERAFQIYQKAALQGDAGKILLDNLFLLMALQNLGITLEIVTKEVCLKIFFVSYFILGHGTIVDHIKSVECYNNGVNRGSIGSSSKNFMF